MSTESTYFDYSIIGAGAAGLQLALKLIEDPYFHNHQILVIEKDLKDQNDRTWSFWEKGSTSWDSITTKSWSKGSFISSQGVKKMILDPYRYKTIRSKDFYRYAIDKISSTPNFTWLKGDVEKIDEENNITIVGTSQKYRAGHVFDSRISTNTSEFESSNAVIQHFKGWIIEAPEAVFDPEDFTMMDYRLKWNETTSFTYILPFDERRALVEFTFFSPDLVDEEVYDKMLKEYISKYLLLNEFKILETEMGSIPMSDYPFHKHHSKGVTKIGTAGGWVRPSTGYSFKNADRYTSMIVDNIKQGRKIRNGIARNRFRKYDTLFLDVLRKNNELGEVLFHRMYNKNSVQQIFKFLDEQTSFIEDISIMSSFNPWPFISSIPRNIRNLLLN